MKESEPMKGKLAKYVSSDELKIEDKELKRGLNLPLTIFIIIGVVIGSSIWLNPATYLYKTGPSVWLAYLLAVIPSIFVAYITAYLGSAVPISGGTYIIISRTVSPFTGFLALWGIILAVAGTLAAMAMTFGIFFVELFNVPSDTLLESILVGIIGAIILIVFFLLNLLRVEISGKIELLITIIGDLLVMLVFIIAGFDDIKVENLRDMFPNGFTPFLFALLTFTFSYAGFSAVIDVAGEVKNPKKNIPRALLISIFVLVILYTLQAFVVAGIHQYGIEMDTVTEIILYNDILPEWMVKIMTVLIATAIASTIHPLYLAFSRDILLGGRDKILPHKFGKVNTKFHTPIAALSLILGLSLIIFILALVIKELTGTVGGIGDTASIIMTISAVAILLAQVLICFSAVFFPKKFPQFHEHSGFRPKITVLKVMGWLGFIISILFMLIVFVDEAGMIVLAVFVPAMLIGVVYYFIRKAYLKKKDPTIISKMKDWPDSIEISK